MHTSREWAMIYVDDDYPHLYKGNLTALPCGGGWFYEDEKGRVIRAGTLMEIENKLSSLDRREQLSLRVINGGRK